MATPSENDKIVGLRAIHQHKYGEVDAAAPTNGPTALLHMTSNIKQVLEAFQNRKDGLDFASDKTVYDLNNEEYHTLRRILEGDKDSKALLHYKTRFDYDPVRGIIIVRMPTPLHDMFGAFVADEILDALKLLADREPDARSLIEGIRDGRGVIHLHAHPGKVMRREPDVTLHHEAAPFPSVVIEVAYSNKKHVEELPDDYILNSKGKIKTVVILDIEYKKSARASISVFRQKFTINAKGEKCLEAEQVVNNQLFRDSDGNAVSSTSASLEILLEDFVLDGVTDKIPRVSATITSEVLHNCLVRAEKWYQTTLRQDDVPDPGFILLRRKAIPPEELDEADEEKYRDKERKSEWKSDEADETYVDV